jgi:large subunit ribosomal protein L13
MPTYLPKIDEANRKWFIIDAKDRVLGKIAARAATILSGKYKPTYTPFLDTGDHVVVINCEAVRLSGRKEEEKVYHRHSGYPGGLRTTHAKDVRQDHPSRIIEDAIKGMLPKTKLGRAMFKKLKVYAGASHPHQAQRPEPLSIQ